MCILSIGGKPVPTLVSVLFDESVTSEPNLPKNTPCIELVKKL